MFRKSLSGQKNIDADTITASRVKTTHIVDEDGLSFGNSIQTSNLIDNDKELLSTLKPLGTAGTGTFNTIAPHAESSRANDCIVVFEHDTDVSSHHFISAKLQDNIIKIDKIHSDVLGVVADNSATKLLKTNDAYSAFHSANNETSGKWIFTTEPVYKTGGVEYVLQHATSSNVVGHHATNNASSTHPKIGATGSAWQKSAGSGVGAVQYIVVNDTNGQLQTETKKQTYHKDNYKPSNYSDSDILVVAGNDLHKASPYFILTTDTDGKILGKYIYDSVFSMFPMGSTAGGADARPSNDRYKQGLVPEGSATHNNTYLRKDGTWGTPIDTNTDTNTFVNPTSVVALGGIADGSKITDDDADNFFEFGRGKIGYNGADSDDFCIAHRDYFSNVNYALKQDADGGVNINAPTGRAITFKINDALKEVVDTNNHNFLINILVGSSNNIQLQKTSGTNITSTDNDTIYEFGRGKLGYNGADADTFCIAHRDNMSNVNYALAQGADGTTLINAKTGTAVALRVNDVSIAFVSATALVSNFNILSNITSGEVLTSNDADLTATIGRAKVGYMGHSDWAGFGHRDRFSITDCAISQSMNGDSVVNAPTGACINFRINNVSSAVCCVNDFTFNSNIIVDASHTLSLLKTSGSILTTSDNDTIFEMGRAKVGYMGHSDWAGFGHRDRFSITDCAIYQSMNGDTIVNAPTGACVNLRINNVSSAVCCADDFTFNSNIIIDASHTLSLLKTSGSILTTTDNDTIFEMGRCKLGYVGHADWAGFAHRDNFTTTSYALLQGSNGDTLLNAKSGQTIHLRVNNTSSASITTNDFTFLSNAIVDSSHKLGLLKTSGSVITTSDNDTIYELGRGKIGYSGNSDEFSFGHRDCFTATDCALIQDEVGATILNAKTGQLVKIGINDTSVIEIAATEVVLKKKLEFSGFTSGTNFIISDGSSHNNNNWIECGGLKMGSWTGGGTYGALYYKGITNSYHYTFLTNNSTTYINATTYTYLLTVGQVRVRIAYNEFRHYVPLVDNSDIRIKGEIEDLDDCWDAFKSIKVKKYKKILKDSNDNFRIGVIADEIEVNENELIRNAFSAGVEDPKNLTELKDGTKIDAVKAVEYQQLYRMSMVVVQQLQERVERLEQIIINNNLT
jgi:hypothetical protein